MDIIFSKILSMSLSASFVIAAVLLLRLLLRKAPKKYSYFLWLLVFFRLLCPFSIESAFSLIPVNADAIAYQTGTDESSIKVNTGVETVDWVVNRGITAANQKFSTGSAFGGQEAASTEVVSAEKKAGFLDKVFSGMMILWITGVILLTVVSIAQVLRLRWKLRTAVLVTSNINRNGNKDICPIYESEHIQTAFLLGILRPRIYLPLGIEEERGYVIAHEMMHKRRGDYLVKPICYLAVILHWFNPLVWLSFYLMTKDMEMSCDEQVLKGAIEDIRSEYSRSLLNVSVKGSGLSIPLAFGESNTKERIKHVLKYKKPSTWIGIGAIVVVFAAAVLLLTTNTEGGNDALQGNIAADSQGTSSENSQGASSENSQGASSEDNQKDAEEDVQGEWQKISYQDYQELVDSRNPYIGDASAVGQLLNWLPQLEGYSRKGYELVTEKEPYELKITLEKTATISVNQEQENIETIKRNAVFLFATIENMDICTFVLDNDDVISWFSYDREELESIFGDLYIRSETLEGLQKLEEDLKANEEQMDEALNSIYESSEKENTDLSTATEQEIETLVDNLISQAIIKYAKTQFEKESNHVEAHAILGGEEYVFQQMVQSDKEMVFYILARDSIMGKLAYNAVENVTEYDKVTRYDNAAEYSSIVKETAGIVFPAKVTIAIAEDGSMEVTDFWVPREGASMEDDIKENFPEEFWDAALYMNGYREQLQEELLEKAIRQMDE